MTEDDKGSRAKMVRAEYLRTKQVRLLNELEILDLHSKYCWEKIERTGELSWKQWYCGRQPSRVQVPGKLDCYC